MTQFGRALHELNIDIICANSSQAKGRVERAYQQYCNHNVVIANPSEAHPSNRHA